MNLRLQQTVLVVYLFIVRSFLPKFQIEKVDFGNWMDLFNQTHGRELVPAKTCLLARTPLLPSVAHMVERARLPRSRTTIVATAFSSISYAREEL